MLIALKIHEKPPGGFLGADALATIDQAAERGVGQANAERRTSIHG